MDCDIVQRAMFELLIDSLSCFDPNLFADKELNKKSHANQVWLQRERSISSMCGICCAKETAERGSRKKTLHARERAAKRGSSKKTHDQVVRLLDSSADCLSALWSQPAVFAVHQSPNSTLASSWCLASRPIPSKSGPTHNLLFLFEQ